MPILEVPEKVLQSVEKLLHQARGKISPADAAAATGLSLQDVKDSLARLIELYECRVTLNESTGGLLFAFDYPLRRHGQKTLREHLYDLLAWGWKIFKVVYKAAIGVILIVYTVAFVILLLALMVAGSKGGKDSDGLGDLIGGLFRAILEGFRLAAWTGMATHYAPERGSTRYKKYQPEPNKGKSFIQSVYSFVFGPERPPFDPLADAREAAAFIRKNRGRLTAGHLIALAGPTYDRAEALMAEYAVRFRGELEIAENGTVVGTYTDLMESVTSDLAGGVIEYYPDEVEPPYEYTGNSTGRNVGIACMNLFNLVMSLVGLGYFTFEAESCLLAVLLGYFPLLFSLLFFAIPIARIPFIMGLRHRRERSVMRKRLLRAIMANPRAPLSLEGLVRDRVLQPEEEPLARSVLEQLLREMRGNLDLDPNGIALYSFPRLAADWAAA